MVPAKGAQELDVLLYVAILDGTSFFGAVRC